MWWAWLLVPICWAAPRIPSLDDVIVGTSPGYIEASRHLTGALNLSVDPCDNFFEFACGTWIKNNPIPADLTSFNHFQKLREKVMGEMRALYESPEEAGSKSIRTLKNFYKECMDVEKIDRVGPKELLDSVKSLGYWPMVHQELWSENNFDLTDLLVQLAVHKGIDVFVESYGGTDTKNVSRRMMQFDQGTLGLGSSTREYYLNKDKYKKQMNAYRKYLVAKTSALTEDAGLPVNVSKIERDVDEIIEFETDFAKILVPDEERRNFTALYNIRRFNDLNSLMPIVDWNRMFRAMMPYSVHDYLNSNPEIIISEIDYFRRLTDLLKCTDPRVIVNFVMLKFSSAWSLQLGTKYEDISQDFAREMYGRKEKSPRWKTCVSYTNGQLSYASGSMYVRAHFNKESKNTTLSMIRDLQESFHGMLTSNDWMDSATKEMAKDKLAEIQKQIGFPDFILDDTKLDDYYKKLDIVPEDSYAKMIEKQIKFSLNLQFNRLLEKVDRAEFSANAATINAFYSSIKNSIIFPAAILQVPFFHQSYPKFLNYGGIGAVVGHEITHGFDDQGRQFDAIGNLREWWDETTAKHFTEKAECFIQQYGETEVPFTGLKINGKLTQGENIADNGGVKQAYKAYQRYLEMNGEEKRIPSLEQYDNHQMFFIGYSQSWCGSATHEASIRQLLSDPHAPGRYRVNIVLQNQPEFAAAFQCPVGSPMNPTKRCALW